MQSFHIIAYPIMDRIQVQATSLTTTDSGRQWAHLILEQISLPGGSDDPWDVLWAVGQELCESALKRGAVSS